MNDIENAITNFKAGKIGIFPTDTAFGIGTRMDNIDSVRKVYEIRNRPEEKALIALVGSIEMAKEYVYIDSKVEKLLSKYWPGGLTVILSCRKEKVPSIVRADGETLAVRLPDHTILREIINRVGVPIVAPSANYSGGSTPVKLSEVDKSLLSKVDFKLSGVCTMEGVSTIIDTVKSPWSIVRQGVVTVENLDQYDKTEN